MYPSTENLLKIRDGEPIDADAIAYAESDPSAIAELRRLRQTQQALIDLPEFDVPEGVWDRVVTTAADSASPVHPRWQIPLGGAIAASVAVLALLLVARTSDVPETVDLAPTAIVAETVPTNRIDAMIGTPSYASLVSESARLDRVLSSIGYQPQVVRGDTAATILAIQDQIAVLDDRMSLARSLGLNAEEIHALWEQRVYLMNALVYMRYSQAQLSGR